MSVQRDSAPQGGTLLDQPSQNPGPGVTGNFDSGPGDYNSSDLMREEGEDEAYPEHGRDPDDELEEDQEQTEEGDDEAQDEDEGEDQDPNAQQLGPLEAPANWPDEARQAFGALPPILQHHYMNSAKYMMADYTRKTQALAQERKSNQELTQILGPRQQAWMLQGMRPAQAIGQLLALSDFADKDFGGFVKYLAQQRGIDLQSALGLNESQEEDEYTDPQVKGLKEKLNDLETMLQQAGQYSQQQAQQKQQAEYVQRYTSTASAIDNAAQARNQDGTLQYPHLDFLADDMAGFIESGHANSLEEAYDRALHANPQTRRLVMQRQQAQQNEQLRKNAARASRASASITGAHASGGASSTDGMSIRQLLEATSDGRL